MQLVLEPRFQSDLFGNDGHSAGEEAKRIWRSIVEACRQFAYPVSRVGMSKAFRPLCEDLFRELAAFDANELFRLIEHGDLTPAHLTFAAEALGEVTDPRTIRALLAVSRHPDAVVREGAILGMRNHLTTATRSRLVDLASNDASAGVRAAAADALDA